MQPSTCPPASAPADVLWDEVVAAGGYTVGRAAPRGAACASTDVDGRRLRLRCSLHRADRPAERLNVADTVKVQWQAYLGAGPLLLSDMGRVLMTIVDDTSGRHDALCGTIDRGGATRPATATARVDGPTPNGRDLLAVAAGQARPRARATSPPSVNLFKGVRVGDRRRARASTAPPRPGTASSCGPSST